MRHQKIRPNAFRAVGCLLLQFLAQGALAGVVINVPTDQPTIQAAIDAAVNGDTVLVAPGTYAEAINFSGKAILVASSGGSDVTTISGAGLNTSIIKFIMAEGAGSVLEGFAVIGGAAGTGDANGARRGGAVYASGSSPTIRDCVFADNIITGMPPATCPSSFGGAIFHENGSMTLIDCDFVHNESRGSFGNGGAIYALSATNPLVIGCTFVDNAAVSSLGCAGVGNGHGGAVFAGGGGIFINCVFRDNQAFGAGGIGGASRGGGITGGQLFVNCEFSGNSIFAGNTRGAGVFTSGMVIGCTVVNNVIGSSPIPGAAGGVDGGAGLTVVNSIVTGNTSAEIFSGASVSYSCIEGGFAGTGNIDADPLFMDVSLNDFRLSDGSPCRDIGSNADLPPDTYDLDGDGDVLEAVSLDVGMLRRVVNGVVDMGAHEWQADCAADVSPSSPGIAGDGTVDVNDLLAVINGWGACLFCPADINGDHDVDVDDLLAVINAWGPCPAR